MDFEQYYRQNPDYHVFSGPRYQRGYGLGSIFKKFFRWIVPLAKQHIIPLAKEHALPVLKEGLKTVGNQALQTTTDIATDLLSGKNIKESVRENGEIAIENLKRKAETKLAGGRIHKRRKQEVMSRVFQDCYKRKSKKRK